MCNPESFAQAPLIYFALRRPRRRSSHQQQAYRESTKPRQRRRRQRRCRQARLLPVDMAATFVRKKGKIRGTSAPSSTTEDASPAAPSPPPVSQLLLKGTKPWTGGIALVSTGLKEWDALLLGSSASSGGGGGGGGQPLGTAILLEQDRWTGLAGVLARYWCAEVSMYSG